ncbi:cytochrome P450 family protein [Dactylosporangium cerinum]
MAHPDQLEALKADPGLWRGAVEEMLRYDSPVQNTARVCQRPVEIAGTRLQPGHVVVPMLGGANRDPAVFADPDRFDVTRSNARDHLSFSGGVHYCLGAALARLEGEVGLKALFDRHPDLAIDGPRAAGAPGCCAATPRYRWWRQ